MSHVLCLSCGARVETPKTPEPTSAVRTYVLVITDRHHAQTQRKAVRAYDSADAARRFAPTSHNMRNGRWEANEILRDVEPYEPERRADHRGIELRDYIEAP